MNCSECECLQCLWKKECGSCGLCDMEHPHQNGCCDYQGQET